MADPETGSNEPVTPVKTPDSEIVISYMNLRRAIGFIGVGLPFALLLGEWIIRSFYTNAAGPQPSMSEYYYTAMRGVFVGSMCAIGTFLGSYRGEHKHDRILATIACVSAIGVALFPCTPAWDNPEAWRKMLGVLHYSSAGILFATLGTFCVWLFPRFTPDGSESQTALAPGSRKPTRNRFYKICGWTIYGCIAGIGVWTVLTKYCFPHLGEGWTFPDYPVFWLEVGAVEAFGFSWLIKGHAILGDTRPARSK